MKRQLYVCGFAYNGEDVLLIRKSRPEWQVGKLNGVGGHVQDLEAAICAMCREFQEETALNTEIDDWTIRVRLEHKDWVVIFFRAELNDKQRGQIKSMTDEQVRWIRATALNNAPYQLIPNLRWLIPLCHDADLDPDSVIVLHTNQFTGM